MEDLVTINATGRVTADFDLKTSTNGKNTKYVQFGFAVNRGYGENEHPNYYTCVLYGAAAQRIVDAKVKKGSSLSIVGNLDLESYTRKDGSEAFVAKITVLDWCYGHTSKSKENAQPSEDKTDENGFTSVEDCGEEGLPFGA